MQNTENTPAVANEIEMHIEGGACRCGCGETPSAKRNFRPGHDQRLMGILTRAVRENATFLVFEQPETTFGATPWQYGQMFLSDTGVAKLEKYFANEPKRRRASRAAAVAPAAQVEAPVADPLPETVKIGRWTYPVVSVRRNGNGEIVEVAYTGRDGSEHTAYEKFSIVA